MHPESLGRIVGNLSAALLSRFSDKKFAFYIAETKRDDLNTLRDLMQSGKLTPVIDRTCNKLSETPDAIRYLEEGHARGKVIITVANGPSLARAMTRQACECDKLGPPTSFSTLNSQLSTMKHILKGIVKWTVRLVVLALIVVFLLIFVSYWRSTNDCGKIAAPTTPMKAIVYCDYGTADVLKARKTLKNRFRTTTNSWSRFARSR